MEFILNSKHRLGKRFLVFTIVLAIGYLSALWIINGS